MKTVVITGASRGIGLATAKKFLEDGYFVIGTSTTGEIPIESPHIFKVPLNLSANFSIEKAAEEIQKKGKEIDILINNAGALYDLDEVKVTISKLRATLEVNVIGTIDFTERMLNLIKKGGHIVNVSSGAGSILSFSDIDYPSYRISKAALNMYTRLLAKRLTSEDIVVSAVHPGWVKTDMGGEGADMEPEEAAVHLFALATSEVPTGEFWFKGEKRNW